MTTSLQSLQNMIANMQALGFSKQTIIDKLKSGVNDCQRFIAREEGRSADLRPEKDQQHLNYCHSHKAELLSEIERLNAA